ncbi:hypothetical protein BCR39DRAFT_559514 [Naematelia encephala]|uniref:Uncharacterized protein n=1 Tax=Naematelia encephala TaxID=71784 RepID=A0A1Y2B336_9TREE|nr:hypothetical protein BCR39DRAFT_559514 [Naematelia encephala]
MANHDRKSSYGLGIDDVVVESRSTSITPLNRPTNAKSPSPLIRSTEANQTSTYLSKLIDDPRNSPASTRLLKIIQSEAIALDTYAGLKLLELAEDMRVDGPLGPKEIHQANENEKEKEKEKEKDTMAIENRLNDFAEMLNVIAEAVGVNLLENDDDLSTTTTGAVLDTNSKLDQIPSPSSATYSESIQRRSLIDTDLEILMPDVVYANERSNLINVNEFEDDDEDNATEPEVKREKVKAEGKDVEEKRHEDEDEDEDAAQSAVAYIPAVSGSSPQYSPTVAAGLGPLDLTDRDAFTSERQVLHGSQGSSLKRLLDPAQTLAENLEVPVYVDSAASMTVEGPSSRGTSPCYPESTAAPENTPNRPNQWLYTSPILPVIPRYHPYEAVDHARRNLFPLFPHGSSSHIQARPLPRTPVSTIAPPPSMFHGNSWAGDVHPDWMRFVPNNYR